MTTGALTLASGVQAAIGADYDAATNRLVVAEFYGRVSEVDLTTQRYRPIGVGYDNPEDVTVHRDLGLLLTERSGALLRLAPGGGDRTAPSTRVLADGMTAPQQIALSADGTHAYVVEYAASGTLWEIAVTASPPTKRAVMTGLRHAVGIVLHPSQTKAYISEQDDGSVSLVDLATGTRVGAPVATGLTAPFFLSWGDATGTRLLVPLRDPSNSVVALDLSTTPATRSVALDGLSFRPSSATVVPGGGVIVCTDRDIVRYDPAPSTIAAFGLGGGGAMFDPRPSPRDPNQQVVACDMGGLYRTTDGGETWKLQDVRQVGGSARFSAVWDPSDPAGHLIGAHRSAGLREFRATQASLGWRPLQPALNYDSSRVTCAAITPDGRTLLVGIAPASASDHGRILRTDLSAQPWDRRWTEVEQATAADGSTVLLGDPIALVCPENSTLCLAADTDRVLWSADGGRTWRVLERASGGGLPARTPGRPYYDPSQQSPLDPANYRASRIRGLAAAAASASDPTVVYATVVTDLTAGTFDGGVFRCELTGVTDPAAPPAWANVTAGLDTAHSPDLSKSFAPWPMYEKLAVPQGRPDLVYVSAIPASSYEVAGCWAVWRGTYNNGSMAWTGVYDGFPDHAAGVAGTCVVEHGWVDQTGKPGWGFGGPARGLGTGAGATAPVLYSSNAIVNRAEGNATPMRWRPRYSRSSGPAWASTGLDVTTVHRHHIHPTSPNVRFLCCTDIGLSRSTDGGASWTDVSVTQPVSPSSLLSNFYELAFSGTATIHAAVSAQHDLPHDTQANVSPKAGAVLRSTDLGATWARIDADVDGTGTGFTKPVTSIVARAGTLYAAVWRGGVYASTDDGVTWTSLNLPAIATPAGAYRVLFDAAGRLHCVVAGRGGGLYRRQGDGSWTNLTASLSASGAIYPMDVAPPPGSGGSWWMATNAVGGVRDGAVYRSDDDGATWTPRLAVAQTGTAYGPYLHAFGAFHDPTDLTGRTVYATTTTHGVWVTTDDGGTWRELRSIPFLSVQRIAFDPVNDPGAMVLTTFGGGAWRASTDAAAQALRQRIRLGAYQRYAGRGYTNGRATQDWLEAQAAELAPLIRRRAYFRFVSRHDGVRDPLGDWLAAERETLALLQD